ncbi:MAG TPA: hypothetical protein VI685_17255 [Candidatus Angelobacter sp.]
MKKLRFAMLFLGLGLLSSLGWSDTLRLKNGSTIIGRYAGGSDDQISFRVGGSVQRYDISDVISVTFDSHVSSGSADDSGSGQNGQYQPPPPPPPQDQDRDRDRDRDQSPPPPPPPQDQSDSGYRHFSNNVTVPAGTRIVVRTIDSIDSDKNRVGDRFAATLDEPLYVNDLVVAPRGTNVYGRLEEVKQSGQLSGRSQLRLALTGMTINGQTVPLSTSDYQLAGKSRGADTAKKVGGGAALGAIIGAVAGGGKGAAIGAGVGAGAGTAVQIVTHGDQVHVPSETVLEFSLNQPITVARAQ